MRCYLHRVKSTLLFTGKMHPSLSDISLANLWFYLLIYLSLKTQIESTVFEHVLHQNKKINTETGSCAG